MKNIFSLKIKSKIPTFNKTISVEGDKSISHRALLLASQTTGISKIKGILESEDVLSTINVLKELGVRIIKIKSEYLVYGNGLNYEYTCSFFTTKENKCIGPFIAKRKIVNGHSWIIEVNSFPKIKPIIRVGNNIGDNSKFNTIVIIIKIIVIKKIFFSL